ncbi:hypothetical protein LITTLEE_108 [Mycobacterium phage LittleE]|uniref:Uncharacterized protein n=4 Tax=Omegavirus TaxID=1623292 RepID=Q854F4_BPMOM|nr:gp114 [Mycobacterium phage Omega]YP_009011998.1 hypothetical protein CM09_gp099 [Mycobacterium phage Courthouse]YP_009205234.1 hypothetical protein AVT17_gp104 [Mycobacterium phage Ariel]YP_009213321.1 hypothetical protein AVV70_gp104 [Mycobacterium phage MiaZeal]YP_009637019.1 hypothetical protein FGG27_gp108 [Mycobacterium phage LittleE]ASD50731.1 hypothetical protein PORCELAIN_102 [Mycobacterium phage Porcelain]ASD53494.1 hypothetical protein PBI_LUCKY2013_101 [Mycobacterium phage Lucky
MNAAEIMQRRIDLYEHLTDIDQALRLLVGGPMTPGAEETAFELLEERDMVCHLMREVGYEPWDSPFSEDETKVL